MVKPVEAYVCDALFINPDETNMNSLEVTFIAGQAKVEWEGVRMVPLDELAAAITEAHEAHASAVAAAKADRDA